MSEMETVIGVSAVAVQGRAILIEGSPGSGKSSLALAMIDRGATLIGDDGVTLESSADRVTISPPPNIAGKLEIRGIGIVDVETASAPLALVLTLASDIPRLPDQLEHREILGHSIPILPFQAGNAIQAIRAEWALRKHGLSF